MACMYPRDLASVGSRVHPDYIRQFIVDPHGLKPGTGMPRVLGQLDPEEQQETAEAIPISWCRLSREFHAEVPDADASAGCDCFIPLAVLLPPARGETVTRSWVKVLFHSQSAREIQRQGTHSVSENLTCQARTHAEHEAGPLGGTDISSYPLSLPLKKRCSPEVPTGSLILRWLRLARHVG